jgi:hypothetical protein
LEKAATLDTPPKRSYWKRSGGGVCTILSVQKNLAFTKLKVGQNLNEKWFSSISRLFVALGTGLDYEQEVNFHLVIFQNK